MTAIHYLALGQAIYFFVTGVWPLVHMTSFLAVSGQKTDLWLVRTVGVLLAVIALALLADVFNRQIGTSTFILAFGSALGLCLIEIIYTAKKVIPPIYLLDAAVEVIIMLLWLLLYPTGQTGAIMNS